MDAFIFHHYLQRGIPLSELKNLTYSEKIFMLASAELELEQKKKLYQSMGLAE